MKQPIGVLGGTFDPIHNGHLAVAEVACAVLDLADVLVVPSHYPPHRSTEPQASPYHRFAMATMAVFSKSGRRPWLVSDLELVAEDPSYTAVTLRKLHERGFGALDLFFMTGADAFAEIPTWKDYPAILDLAHFAVVSRPGHPASRIPDAVPALRDRMIGARIEGVERELAFRRVADNERCPPGMVDRPQVWLIDLPDHQTPDVSSTEIRRLVRTGESIRGMVPDIVEAYIRRYGLYGATRAEDGRR